jgi:ribonuclease HI
MRLIVTTDGACSGNGQESPAAAFAFSIEAEGKPEKTTTSSAFKGGDTNNFAEALAVYQALQHVLDVCTGIKGNAQGRRVTVDPTTVEIVLVTDSQYVVGAFSGWNRNANANLLAAVDGQIARFRTVSFTKVKGHPTVRQLRDPEWCGANPDVVRHAQVDKLAAAAAQDLREGKAESMAVAAALIG